MTEFNSRDFRMEREQYSGVCDRGKRHTQKEFWVITAQLLTTKPHCQGKRFNASSGKATTKRCPPTMPHANRGASSSRRIQKQDSEFLTRSPVYCFLVWQRA